LVNSKGLEKGSHKVKWENSALLMGTNNQENSEGSEAGDGTPCVPTTFWLQVATQTDACLELVDDTHGSQLDAKFGGDGNDHIF
jgi:hypothetical protein